MTKSGQLQSGEEKIYQPLDKSKDEIRLVTIELDQKLDMVICDLQTVSLQDLCLEYTSFIESYGLEAKSPRQCKPLWVKNTHLPAECSSKEESNEFLGIIPSPEKYRYRWGDFTALSYVWGDNINRASIILNGQTVPATENLEIALRSLAKDYIFSGRYRLWIDAICINQDDEIERADQVQKMREIYSSAWAVIAWMGMGQGYDSFAAFSLLRTLASLKDDEKDLDLLASIPGKLPEGHCFSALHDLMNQTYWSRLWIVQEVVMGASSTFIRCGNQLMDWQTFCRGFGVLYHGSNWNFKDLKLATELRAQGIYKHSAWKTKSSHLVHMDLRQLTRLEEDGGKWLNLRRLLDLAKNGHCRDVRDKVFAVAAMMDPHIRNEVTEAYSLEPPQLFSKVARAFITHTRNLEPLRQGNPWGPANGPTWAADWTWRGRIRFSRPEYSPAAPPYDPSLPELEPDKTYCAHGGIPASYHFPNDWRLLNCDGFIFDKVVGLGAREAGLFDWARSSAVQCPSWKSAYGGEGPTSQSLWNALLLSIVGRGKRAQEHHSALLSLPASFWVALPQFEQRGWKWLAEQRGYWFKWSEWRRGNDHLMLGGRSLGSYFSDGIPNDAEELTYTEVYLSVQRTVQQRRFLLTMNGYFGWGPDNVYGSKSSNHMKVGDKLVIVFGCSTPLVIRPEGDKFKVVGEAYIEGFMDGEALSLLESGSCQRQTFTFC